MNDSNNAPCSSGNWLFLTLFLSGFAALINQVVWQRSIKIFLGGADAICSMLVVLAFMLGLGIGSLIMGKKAGTLQNPIRNLAQLEAALFIVNLLVLALLRIDLGDSIFAFQRAAISIGVPIKLLYAITGIGVLIIPCSLMGMIMPVASEVAYRQLQFKNSWLVDHMFFINTLGSFCGALFTGFKLLPFYGQTACLILAASLNLTSSMILANMKTRQGDPLPSESQVEVASKNEVQTHTSKQWWFLRDEEIATFFLGFVSLGYEMYLFRVIPLVKEPLPYTFSMILSFYLLSWAAGVLIAGHLKDIVLSAIAVGSLAIFFTPFVIMYDRIVATDISAIFAEASYYIPCVIFGMLFGQLLNRFISNWGADVGKFMGLNTLGSCLGIVVTTMIGGGIYHAFNAWILALIMQSVGIWLFLRSSEHETTRKYCGIGTSVVAFVVLSLFAVEGSVMPHVNLKYITYSDPVGVTEITSGGNMIWDGLWHSELSDGRSHIGSNNWMHAVIPILCMPDTFIEDALVIGLGTGITAGTLVKSSQIGKVRSYEINKSLDLILQSFPKETLNILKHPKSEIIWQDARSGLALDEKKFQLITQQPLYLKQAGSSNLLSEEYLRSVSKRLADNGVFLVYANSQNNSAQKMVVRKTLESVFPFCMSFMDGYMYVVSRSPVVFTRESLTKKLAITTDALINEIKAAHSLETLLKLQDPPNDAWKKCPVTITDDYPVLEYPNELLELSKHWR